MRVTMRENLTTGAVPFRKAVITSFVDRIEVDDHEIRIMGDKGTLERAVLGGSGSSGAEPGGVRSLVRNWRRGSPPHPRPPQSTAVPAPHVIPVG